MESPLTHPSERDRLVASLQAVEDALADHGIEHLAIYGSRARGDFRHDSDLDVLIDVAQNRIFSLIDLIKVEHELRARLGIPVSVAMRRSLEPRLRSAIANEIIEVF